MAGAGAVGALRAAVADVLEGLDETLLEYVQDAVIDEESGEVLPRDELVELVAPMLDELCGGDGAAAEARADDVWRRLTEGEGAATAADEELTHRLESAVRIGEGGGEAAASDVGALAAARARAAASTAASLPTLSAKDEAKSRAHAQRSAARDAARREAAAQAATDAAAALASEMEAARERAARHQLRNGRGALGAQQIGPFQVPNPGGGADLIQDANLTLVPGHRYGLIGRNGKGKSTLLRALASRRVPGLGEGLSVYYVTQDVALTAEQEGWDAVALAVHADVARRLLLAEEAELGARAAAGSASAEDAQRLAEVESALEEMGARAAPQRARDMLSGLGFSAEMLARPLRALSGGWRVRAALGAALFARPDVLLLDEPTNHLSIAAVLWLARELGDRSRWAGRVIVCVSHDRAFIDEVCTDTLHISGAARRLTSHRGNYTAWAARRAEQQKAWHRRAELRRERQERLEEFAGHGFRYGGSSSQINMMQKKAREAEKLEEEARQEARELAALNEDRDLPLALRAGGKVANYIVRLEGAGFRYPAEGAGLLFSGVDLSVDSATRLCLLGENGAGKSTLVKVLMGALEPTEGRVSRAPGARVALVNQHHADQLDLDATPLDFMLGRFPGDGSDAHERELRACMASAGVLAEQQGAVVRSLSGGQRSRVAMAAVSYERPHCLVLDEPTNNLDLEAIEALADCIERFEGAVLLVSHDQYFVERVAEAVVVVGGGAVRREESFAAYKKRVVRGLTGAAGRA